MGGIQSWVSDAAIDQYFGIPPSSIMQLVIKVFGKDCKVGSARLNFNKGTMQIHTFARHFTPSNWATVPVAVEPKGQAPKATRRLCDWRLVGRQESNYVVCRVPAPTGSPAKDVALRNYRPLHVLSLQAKIVSLHPSSLCPSRLSRPDLSYRPISTETSGLFVFCLFSCMCVCVYLIIAPLQRLFLGSSDASPIPFPLLSWPVSANPLAPQMNLRVG